MSLTKLQGLDLKIPPSMEGEIGWEGCEDHENNRFAHPIIKKNNTKSIKRKICKCFQVMTGIGFGFVFGLSEKNILKNGNDIGNMLTRNKNKNIFAFDVLSFLSSWFIDFLLVFGPCLVI